ncbi:hypothetical protein ACI2KV_24080 [Micromonospora chokoriensis]
MSEAGWGGQDQPFVAVDRQGDSLLAWAGCDSNSVIWQKGSYPSDIRARFGGQAD